MVEYTRSVILSHDTVDSIVADVLIEDYKGLVKNILELESAADLPEYKQQDLVDDRRFHLAMKTILGYYLTADHYFEVVGEPLYRSDNE